MNQIGILSLFSAVNCRGIAELVRVAVAWAETLQGFARRGLTAVWGLRASPRAPQHYDTIVSFRG